MSPEKIMLLVLSVCAATAVAALAWRRWPRRLKPARFANRWRDMQKHLSSDTSWPQALLEADLLLDSALKKRRIRGKTMGERLMSARRVLSDNDGIWFAHNLCKKTLSKADMKLTQEDVRQALLNYRRALQDVGALVPLGRQEMGSER